MMHPNEETLLRYRFETLEPTESKQVADHLRTCSECGARFAIIGKSVEKLSAYDTEQDLDPAVVARALEQVQAAREAWPEEGEPAAAEEEAVAPRLGFLQWLGFEQGAPFREVRFAASAMTLAVAVMLGAGEVYVSAREVQTETRVFGEQQLLPGARSLVRIEVIRPKNNSGVEGANVRAVLVAGTKRFSLFEGKTDAKGTVNAWLEVPNEDLGASELEVTTSARGEEDVVRQAIGVRREFKVHLSTDKPLYQPGQTIHVRALAFESNSMAPATGREVMFEVMDPKGNRLSGKLLKASGFGVAAWDVELSSELPLGEYKVSAAIGGQRTEVPVKVSRYTLPKFKLAVKGAQDTFLAGETLRANLNVRYFFGKAVEKAKVHAVLVREDGSVVGEELNAVTDKGGDLKLAIELPSTLAAPGQPEGLTLQLEVTDGAGQQERKSQGFMVARELVALEVLADLGGIVAGLPNTLYVLTTQPDGRPMACDVSLSPSSGPDLQLRTAENGVGAVVLAPLGQAAGFSVEARATCAAGQRAARRVGFDERLADFDAATDRVLYRPGEVVTVAVVTHSAKDAALVRVFKEGRVVHTQPVAEGKAALSLPANLSGSLELEVTDTGSGSKVTRRIVIADPGGLSVKMTTDADTHRPGATARLRFEVKDAEGKPKAVALGLSVVDESLWALTASRPSAARAFFLLDLALRSPRGQLSAGDLLAGKSFSDADQLAARVLLSSAQPSAHAAAFVQNTLHAEERKLQQDRRTWDTFFEVAIKWLLGVLLIAMAFALGRYASSWLAPIALIAGTFAAMRLAGWRWKGEVFWLGCAAYLVAGIAHSLTRRAMAWGYLVLPVAVFPFLILFGDNVRREFAMSADSLAGNDSAMSVRSPSMERKSMKIRRDPLCGFG